MAIGGAAFALLGFDGSVAVFHPAGSFLCGAGTIIDHYKGLNTKFFTVGEKFIRPHLVGFFCLPGGIMAGGAKRSRTNTVFPVITAGKIPARVTDHGDIEWFKQFQGVLTVGSAIFAPNSVINASFQMFNKLTQNER
ncbi:hypothetical protein SDC9_73422 [bioreactor metagenome]|uniref:Uncharacterized protein n=1 Tax=bioreactor metagenome TaxID=1076179 RepID=A0A644YF96_9ZZZZ